MTIGFSVTLYFTECLLILIECSKVISGLPAEICDYIGRKGKAFLYYI